MTGLAQPLTPKQTEIVDAALRVIGRLGIADLTTSTLAAELGVSAGAPFRHFASRDEILEAVALRVEEVIQTTFPDSAGPPLEGIRSLFLGRTGAVGRHTGIARLMFSEQFSLALPKAAAKRMRNLVEKTRSFLLKSLHAAATTGEIRSDVTPEALLPIVLGTLQSLVFARSLKAVKETQVMATCDTLFTLLRNSCPLEPRPVSKDIS